MRHSILLSGLGLAMGLASTAVSAQGGYYGDPYANQSNANTFRCDSRDGRQTYCASPTGGRAVLVRQLSTSPCIRNQTWASDGRGVWVSRGCRALFAADRRDGWRGNNSGQLLRCESGNGRYQECAMNVRGGVRLVRQLSGSPCVEGRSWGATRSGVWVDHGCRAQFATGYRPGNGWGWGNNRSDNRYGSDYPGDGSRHAGSGNTIRCESNDGRTHHCHVDIRGGARLLRQLSGAPCLQNRNWGWDREGVWVSQGCRAEFGIW